MFNPQLHREKKGGWARGPESNPAWAGYEKLLSMKACISRRFFGFYLFKTYVVESHQKAFSKFNCSLGTANSSMHKIYKVIIPCAAPCTLGRQSHTKRQKSKLRGSWDRTLTRQIPRWTVLAFSISRLKPTPTPQLRHEATAYFFLNKSFSSSEDGKGIARSYRRPMGTPLQTSWHSALPQTPSLWSVFPAALSVTVWLVLLRSPSPASFRCHLFYTRWLLPSNLALPSYLAPGYHPYPKVLTQVLTAGRVRISLLLLWQVQGCL